MYVENRCWKLMTSQMLRLQLFFNDRSNIFIIIMTMWVCHIVNILIKWIYQWRHHRVRKRRSSEVCLWKGHLFRKIWKRRLSVELQIWSIYWFIWLRFPFFYYLFTEPKGLNSVVYWSNKPTDRHWPFKRMRSDASMTIRKTICFLFPSISNEIACSFDSNIAPIIRVNENHREREREKGRKWLVSSSN